MFLLIAVTSSTLALQCYKCDSSANPQCLSSSDHYLVIPVVECNSQDTACFRSDTWVHTKGTKRDDKAIRITRGCAATNRCDYMYEFRAREHESCYTCTASFCNIY